MSNENNEEIKELINELDENFEAWEELIRECDGSDLSKWGQDLLLEIMSEGFESIEQAGSGFTTKDSNSIYSAFELMEAIHPQELEDAFNKWVDKEIDEDTDINKEYNLKNLKESGSLKFENANQIEAESSIFQRPSLKGEFEDFIETNFHLDDGVLSIYVEDIINEDIEGLDIINTFRDDVKFSFLLSGFEETGDGILAAMADFNEYTKMLICEQNDTTIPHAELLHHQTEKESLKFLNSNEEEVRNEIYKNIELLVAKIDVMAEQQGYDLANDTIDVMGMFSKPTIQEVVDNMSQLKSYQNIRSMFALPYEKENSKRRRPAL